MSDLTDEPDRTTMRLEYGSITKRYDMMMTATDDAPVMLSPDPDDDDDVVVDEEEESEELLDGEESEEILDPTLDLLTGNITDPELVKQMLANIQARFKNFEDILADLRAQLGEMHQRDDEILKRMATLNEEIAELNLLESSAVAAGVGPSDNYADIISDYGTEPMTPHLPGKK